MRSIERQTTPDVRENLPETTMSGESMMAVAEVSALEATIKVCRQHGINGTLRGSLLDELLLEMMGRDPGRLSRARRDMQRILSHQLEAINGFGIFSGGTDIKVFGSGEVLDGIHEEVEWRVRHLLGEGTNDAVAKELRLERRSARENDDMPIIKLGLFANQVLLEQIVVTGVNGQDRRNANRAFNVDALSARIVGVDEAHAIDRGCFFKQPGFFVQPFPNRFSSTHLILPKLPKEIGFSKEAFNYYLDGMQSLDAHKIDGVLAITGRGIRKAITFDLPVEEQTTERVATLMKQAEVAWSKVPHNEYLLRKTTRELEVSIVLDSMRALELMRDFEIWRLLANEKVRGVFSDEDKYQRVEGNLKRILMNRNRIYLPHPWLPPNLFAFETAICEVADINFKESSIFELRR